MASVEKKILARPSASDSRSSVGFIVNAGDDKEDLRIELCPFDSEESVIRLSDNEGTVILHDHQEFDENGNRLEITVSDLDEGTYYFEVNDGFFHQVKEIRISS